MRAEAQGYNYNSSKMELGIICSKEFKDFANKLELWFGWLHVVAQVYNYSYNKIKLGSNFKMNLTVGD